MVKFIGACAFMVGFLIAPVVGWVLLDWLF